MIDLLSKKYVNFNLVYYLIAVIIIIIVGFDIFMCVCIIENCVQTQAWRYMLDTKSTSVV